MSKSKEYFIATQERETHRFFNTINEQGAQLAASVGTAKSQEELILGIFGKATYDLTASDVWRWMKMYNTAILLTSVRRAMTVLCSRGLLAKTDKMRVGLYGKSEHLYTLVR